MNQQQSIVAATGATLVLLVSACAADAFEFEDYDFSRWSQEVTECDRLTSHRRDPGHVAPPVTRETMDKPAAIKACREAVANDPDNPRLNYQLGRAFGYSNRGDEAMPYRQKALDAEYPQSTFVIGYLRLIGVTIEQDTCKAYALWQKSARNRRLAALVTLPRHVMRGDFAACGKQPTTADMHAMLDEAATLTDDFYTKMLIEDLQARLGAQ